MIPDIKFTAHWAFTSKEAAYWMLKLKDGRPVCWVKTIRIHLNGWIVTGGKSCFLHRCQRYQDIFVVWKWRGNRQRSYAAWPGVCSLSELHLCLQGAHSKAHSRLGGRIVFQFYFIHLSTVTPVTSTGDSGPVSSAWVIPFHSFSSTKLLVLLVLTTPQAELK